MKPETRFFDLAVLWRGLGLFGYVPRAWRVYRRAGWRGVKVALERAIGGKNDYMKWVRRYDTLSADARAKLARRAAELQEAPLISVLMPTYNPHAAWLREAIEAVRSQIYPHWELCIADDASTSLEAVEVLKHYAQVDPRVKVVFRPENGHISAASNSALALASGTWLALMDHDDLLPAHALFWVADCVTRDRDARMVYSDEDKVDDRGRRFGPYFKPDWNLDLFRSQNMFSHLGVFATALVREVGGFRRGMEGSQDWDLALRCIERIEPRQVRHIPRVLYHWRVHGASTAQSMNAKPYAARAGESALNEHFARIGVRATAQYIGIGYRARYALPDALPLVSIIIPTRDALAMVRRCVSSILQKTSYARYEIMVMDSGSDDSATLDYFGSLAQQPNVRVLRHDRGFNASALYNAAVAAAHGELVALVEDDIEVVGPEWLSEMTSLALQPNVGAVGACLWYPDETLQHGGVVLGLRGIAANAHEGMPSGLIGYAGRAALIQSFSAVAGACMLVRKSAYLQVGGFDAANLPATFNDVDFCLRLREAGYRNVWTPYAELLHHGIARAGEDADAQESECLAPASAYMKQRWAELLGADPAYNPNLSLDIEDFSYAWPPRVELL